MGGNTAITITQSGGGLTVQMPGGPYAGKFESGTTVRVTFNSACCGGSLTDNNTKITWDNNSTWTKGTTPPAPEPPPRPVTYPDISGAWVGGNTAITITQNGVSVAAKMHGQDYLGNFESGTTLRLPFSSTCCAGTLSDNNTKITWGNNSTWTRETTPPTPPPGPATYPDISGPWSAGSTSITFGQSGGSLTVEMYGRSYTGAFESGSTVRVAFSGTCCGGTLSDNNTKINWDNNTVWTKGATPPTPPPTPPGPVTYPDVSGAWEGGTTDITVTQADSSVTAEILGKPYSGAFESGSTVRVAFSGTCCGGTLSENNAKIEWDNNTTWTKMNRVPPSDADSVSGIATVAVNGMGKGAISVGAHRVGGVVSGGMSHLQGWNELRVSVSCMTLFKNRTQVVLAGPITAPAGNANWWYIQIEEGGAEGDKIRFGEVPAAEGPGMCLTDPQSGFPGTTTSGGFTIF